MNLGDFVSRKADSHWRLDWDDQRISGIVVGFDEFEITTYDGAKDIPFVRVLWNTGLCDWMEREVLVVIDESF